MAAIAAPFYYYCFYEAKLFLRKFILLLLFSLSNPLHFSARRGRLEITRLLVESKADVGAMDATSSWWSLGGAGANPLLVGRACECIHSLPLLRLTAVGRR